MRQGVALFAAAALVAATLPFVREHDGQLVELLGKAKIAVTGGDDGDAPKKVDPPALTDIELQYMDDRRDIITAPAHGKRYAELTLDPVYQRAAMSFLKDGNVYEGAVVMTDIKTGRVLVWASYNQGRPRDLAGKAFAPSASVFKVVTGAALVENGVSLNEKFCWDGGGDGGITLYDLQEDEGRDRYCVSIGMALGRSINTIFGRLASKHLTPDKLEGAARRLGWGLEMPFDVPIEQSKLEIPRDDELEFARAAAGFWHTTLSPFQGANLAQTIANKGVMLRSFIVDRVVDEEGQELYRWTGERHELKRVLDERTAWAVTRMMEQTVRNGSSFKTFHDRAGRPFLPDIAVAGKTGTLAKKDADGETLFTWWVGFAPARDPEVALSVLVTNRGPWHVKGTHVAADMLRVYFGDHDRKGVRFPPGYRGPKTRDAVKRAAERRRAAEKASAEGGPSEQANKEES